MLCSNVTRMPVQDYSATGSSMGGGMNGGPGGAGGPMPGMANGPKPSGQPPWLCLPLVSCNAMTLLEL